MNHTRHGFEKRTGLVRHVVRLAIRVTRDEVRRERDVLCVCAEDHRRRQRFAEFFLAARAPETRTVGGGLDHHDRIAHGERRHAFTYRRDIA
jgi:hypothetical protein